MAGMGVTPRSEQSTISLSLIVPTRNEEPNVEPLLKRIDAVPFDVPFEVLFVDDSDDGTEDAVLRLGKEFPFDVRVIHRLPGQRDGGLGSAVVRGLAASRGEYACILDGDLQHPPESVPDLLTAATAGHLDLVIGSRYVGDGSADGLSTPRRALSRMAGLAARVMFPRRCGNVTDPMSGFFLVRTDALDLASVKGAGFKILLEIAATHPQLKKAEVPYQFDDRYAGETKASAMEGIRFLRALVGLRLHSQRTTHYYDIHGIVTVASTARLPELEAFRTDGSVRLPDINVRVGYRHVRKPGGVLYREIFGRFGFAVRIDRSGVSTDIGVTRLIAWSQHVLYTNTVEPVLRWMFAERGYALVHAACLEHEGAAFFITAHTDTGKTTTMLKILDGSDFKFISDDLTIIDPEGNVLPYPKPLTISAHTLHAVKRNRLSRVQRMTMPIQSRVHSKSGRSIGFALARSHFPAATMSAVAQKLVPPPKYHIEQLVPGAQIADKARVEWLFIIERGGVGEVVLEPATAIDLLLENCEDAYGFPPYPAIEMYLREDATGDLQVDEKVTISDGFEGVPALLLRSESLDWAERIGSLITARPSVSEEAVVDQDPVVDDPISIDSKRRAKKHASPVVHLDAEAEPSIAALD